MPRFQFSLRTLFIVVTLLAIPSWYIGSQAKIVAERKALLARIEKNGGSSYDKAPHGNWIRQWLGDELIGCIAVRRRLRLLQHDLDEIEKTFPEADVITKFNTTKRPSGY
jgi:hypothetical protein